MEFAEELEILVRQFERDRKVGAEAAVIGVREDAVGTQRDISVVLGDRVGRNRPVGGVGGDTRRPSS